MVFHIDGAEIFEHREYVIYSWSSAAVCTGEASNSKFLLALVPHDVLADATRASIVYGCLAEYIAWMCETLNEGTFPALGFRDAALPPLAQKYAGMPIVEGYTAAFFSVKGRLRIKTRRCIRVSGVVAGGLRVCAFASNGVSCARCSAGMPACDYTIRRATHGERGALASREVAPTAPSDLIPPVARCKRGGQGMEGGHRRRRESEG